MKSQLSDDTAKNNIWSIQNTNSLYGNDFVSSYIEKKLWEEDVITITSMLRS